MKCLATVLALLFALPATGQIFKVRLKDKGAERKYAAHLTMINGEPFVIGEHKSGLKIQENNITIVGKDFVELWVMDPKYPDRLPYKVSRDGEKEAVSKKSVVAVAREHLAEKNAVGYLLRNQNLTGIVSEYELRNSAIEEIRDKVDAEKRGTQPWFAAQRRLIDQLDRLRIWLEAMSLDRAARQLEKSISKEQKLLKEDAIRDRAEMGMKSIKPIAVMDELVEVASSLSGGQLQFKAFESQHIRLMVPKSMLEDETAKNLL
ncbi:MAG: hypothetical protein KDB53_07455, partial [Planctomycetes bacterium]|nr:hypothetical protein [Planctomycetota bacterium]